MEVPNLAAVEVPARLDPVDVDRTNHVRWHRLDTTQLGVDVVDPDGHEIGMAKAAPNFWHHWEPVDGMKHVLVGRMDKYGFYDGYGDEADFNLNIDPSREFRFILDDVVASMSEDERDELHDLVDGNGHAVECEVTPDEEYYDNWWFPYKDSFRPSPLIGQKVGVYGPWVKDSGHGGRPEIHPSEVIWWRNQPVSAIADGSNSYWRCIVLQDDSNRFDRDEDFDGTPLRPWSKSPRRARLTFALMGIRGQHIRYDLSLHDGLRVFAWPGEDTRTLFKFLPGDTAVTVRKRMANPSQVKARLGRLSHDPDNPDVYHCFLTLDVRIGEGDRGDEGFAEIGLNGRRVPRGPDLPDNNRREPGAEEVGR